RPPEGGAAGPRRRATTMPTADLGTGPAAARKARRTRRDRRRLPNGQPVRPRGGAALMAGPAGAPPAAEAPSSEGGVRRAAGRRAVLLAVVVGGLIRLAWVIWATRSPVFPTDPSEY